MQANTGGVQFANNLVVTAKTRLSSHAETKAIGFPWAIDGSTSHRNRWTYISNHAIWGTMINVTKYKRDVHGNLLSSRP